MPNCWINVVSKDHVLKGIEEGIMQAGHGKEFPLNKLQKDDLVIFYSARKINGGLEKLQAFTAIAEISDSNVFQVELAPLFKPFRRKVTFKKAKEVPIIPLIQKLSFIKNKKHWGFIFKLNLFQIPKEDYELISKQMLDESSQI